jgi:phenylpyruvate tautomerase PptA (4-oxalocrotonate tautomerase family)
MPLLKIQTNAPASGEQAAALLRRASAAVAGMLGKPERYVMVILEHNPNMLFAADPAPLAYLELKSIGLPADRSAEFSAELCRLLEDSLEVPAERVYIELADAPRRLWGWNRGTF